MSYYFKINVNKFGFLVRPYVYEINYSRYTKNLNSIRKLFC